MSHARCKKLFICVMVILALTVPAAAQDDSIKIGVISSLTGSVSTYGQSVRNAVTMAVEDINAAGGINGRQISLVILDDKGDGTEAARCPAAYRSGKRSPHPRTRDHPSAVMASHPSARPPAYRCLHLPARAIRSHLSGTISSGELTKTHSKAGSWHSLPSRIWDSRKPRLSMTWPMTTPSACGLPSRLPLRNLAAKSSLKNPTQRATRTSVLS